MDIGKLTKAQLSEELTKLNIVHSSSWSKERLEDMLIDAMQQKQPTKKKEVSDDTIENRTIISRVKANVVVNFIFFIILLLFSISFFVTAQSNSFGEYIDTGEVNESLVILGILFLIIAIFELVLGIGNAALLSSANRKVEENNFFYKAGIIFGIGLPLIAKAREKKIIEKGEVDPKGTKAILAISIILLLISIAFIIATSVLIWEMNDEIIFANEYGFDATQYIKNLITCSVLLIIFTYIFITSIICIAYTDKYMKTGRGERAMAISSIVNFFSIYGIVFGIKRLTK